MKKILSLIYVLFCFVAVADAGPGYKIVAGGGVPAAGGTPSALYTSATAIYDFENNSNDTKGNYNLSNSGSPTYDSGEKKQGTHSADFEADSSQYFYYADNTAFDLGGGDFSVSFWVRPETISTKVFSKYDSPNGDGYVVGFEYDTAWHLWFKLEASYGSTQNFTTWTPTANTWYHVAMSFDESADQMTIWVSASTFGDVINGSTYTNARAPNNNTAQFWIGRYGSSSYADMKLDEFVWWKGTAITATNAEAIFGGSWR